MLRADQPRGQRMSVAEPTFSVSTVPSRSLAWAARGWFAIALAGQWLFAVYIVLALVQPLALGDGDAVNRTGLITGHVAGDGKLEALALVGLEHQQQPGPLHDEKAVVIDLKDAAAQVPDGPAREHAARQEQQVSHEAAAIPYERFAARHHVARKEELLFFMLFKYVNKICYRLLSEENFSFSVRYIFLKVIRNRFGDTEVFR